MIVTMEQFRRGLGSFADAEIGKKATGAAKLFRELSDEEMRHMERLHKAAESLIAEHLRTKGEPPAEMLAVYQFLHERQIAAAKEVKVLQGMYDGH